MDQNESYKAFLKAMQDTKTLVPLRQSLFTFAPTPVRYVMLTDLAPKPGVELRSGKLTVEKPAILTANMMFEQYFEGFDTDQRELLEGMLQSAGLKALQYKYKNETENVELRQETLETVADRVIKEFQARPLLRSTVIQGVPEMWSLSLMKCAMDLTAQSFPSNLKDLEEHGWFQ